jgi:serine/threonine-protein kinase
MVVDGAQEVKLIDFGNAKRLPVKKSSGSEVVGTPLYMAPEMTEGNEEDQRTDIFSMGIVAHELLTGHHPLGRIVDLARLPGREIERQMLQPLPPLPDSFPGSIRSIVARMNARAMSDRPRSCDEIIADLNNITM